MRAVAVGANGLSRFLLAAWAFVNFTLTPFHVLPNTLGGLTWLKRASDATSGN
jgi:hypothetical protein